MIILNQGLEPDFITLRTAQSNTKLGSPQDDSRFLLPCSGRFGLLASLPQVRKLFCIQQTHEQRQSSYDYIDQHSCRIPAPLESIEADYVDYGAAAPE